MTERLPHFFPLWAALAALAFWRPEPWIGLKPAIVPLLATWWRRR